MEKENEYGSRRVEVQLIRKEPDICESARPEGRDQSIPQHENRARVAKAVALLCT